jgi:RNA polymerase sigma factor (sigma-70 family)
MVLVLADSEPGERLASRALPADHPLRRAFDALHARFERAVLGYIRARVENDSHAQELAQETWLAVWDNLPAYNPVRSSFHTFATYWAAIMVRRYGSQQSTLRRHEVPATFGRLSLEEADDASPVEVLDVLAAEQQAALPPETYAELYTELLRATLLIGGPPHQVLAFGFCKLVGWPPRRIVVEFRDARLQQMENHFEEAYVRESLLPEADVESCFGPLRAAMDKRFDDAVSDPKTLATYPHLRGARIAETLLRAYFTGEPSADITQWWYAVQRRVRTHLLERTRAGPGKLDQTEGTSMLLDIVRRMQTQPARNR